MVKEEALLSINMNHITNHLYA